MKLSVTAALASVAFVGSLSVASADNKAWTTAKDNLPDTSFALSIDIQALAKTGAWAALLPKLMEKEDFKKGVALIKDNCKIDPLSVMTSAVIAGSSTSDKGVAYLALPGFGKAKAVDCLNAVGKAVANKGDKLVVKTDGDIIEMSDGKQSIYVGFIGEVAVVALKEMPDKKALQGWMGGKGAFGKGKLGKVLAKANTSGALFGGSVETAKLAESTLGAQDFVGSLTYSNSTYAMEMHADYADANAAKSAANVATTGIAQLKKSPPFPAVAGLLNSLTVSQNASEVVLKGSMADKDVTDLVKLGLSKM